MFVGWFFFLTIVYSLQGLSSTQGLLDGDAWVYREGIKDVWERQQLALDMKTW